MLRLIFAIHNHQPVGNFSHVFEQVYRESYLPFLDVYETFSHLKLAIHTSGPLMEWLSQSHPEYIERLATLVHLGRLEIIGGPFYEPILAMLPSRDRIGQITSYSAWLKTHLGADVRGIWIPERVWEQSYVRDLAATGVSYTILDDAHFRNAGVPQEDLRGYFVTEDDGKTLFVFPGSEPLRYLIPFRTLDETMSYLADFAKKYPNSVLLHADDGEKFGAWPNTYGHVFREKWLERFFQTLTDNRHWLMTTTPSEVCYSLSPVGKVYLPDGSYREMSEWVLSPKLQQELQNLTTAITSNTINTTTTTETTATTTTTNVSEFQKFLRGGFWRNFKVRYPETDEMYSRMMAVSSRVAVQKEENTIGDLNPLDNEPRVSTSTSHTGLPDVRRCASPNGISDPLGSARSIAPHEMRGICSDSAYLLQQAVMSLYRGQCNCSYWHGAFGGVYLPHLRNAVYHELIAADNALDSLSRPPEPWVEATVGDFNFDAKNEIRLENDKLCTFFAPHRGGIMYELDIKPICHNLLATLSRQPESYHRKIQQFAKYHSSNGNGTDDDLDETVRSTLEKLTFKQEGLERHLQYDRYPRKSFIDLFYGMDVTFEAVRNGQATDYGTFTTTPYSVQLRKKAGKIQILMSASGAAYDAGIQIHKGFTITAGSSTVVCAVRIEGIPHGYQLHFASEWNFAGMPSGAADRYFSLPNGQKLGHLGTPLDLQDGTGLSLTDEWLGLAVECRWNRPTDIFAFPIETVSQSEGGFELVHQSVSLQPHWRVVPDSRGIWEVEMEMSFRT